MRQTRAFVLMLAVALTAIGLFTQNVATTFAHARYDHSDPPAGSMVDGAPFVLKAWFTQEMMSRSSLMVVDETGTQVDLGDGRVDLDDPDRKVMLVSLPGLPTGVYTVKWMTISAEDGDDADGTFAFGVGVTPPAAWVVVGQWRNADLMTTEPFTVRGPWRVRWRLDSAAEPFAFMIVENETAAPKLLLGQPGTTEGVFEEQPGGTYRLMFHNTTPYDVVVEDCAGSWANR
ncbi:MAG TPA: copper resistance CopC family protein [Chloroflexota bacterium]|nr:copper resistance CopC family protein [Chloroflexota bacterium]